MFVAKSMLAALALSALFLGDKGPPSEINASPGGKLKIVYGSPTWRDEFASQWQSQRNWRLGSGGATTLDTAGGLIFEDAIVFPGQYNVGLVSGGSDGYQLVFHHDGINYGNGPAEAKAALKHYDLDPKKQAKALEIGFPKNKEGEGYVFTVRFGPNELNAAFTTAKAKTVKGKFKDTATELTFLERADLEALAKTAAAEQIQVAKADAKKGKILRDVMLNAGDEPKLTFLKAGESSSLSFVKGQTRDAAKPGKTMTAAFETSKDGSFFVIGIGPKEYVFPTSEDLMKDA
jgi:hypothetical protein